ncbi:MAG: hypothetical protein HZA23_02870 [Nitrospirae bacterium]|nr:hypothetical protein [Nitrospirota bacterium]
MNPHLLDALFTRSLTEGKPLRLLLRSHHQLVGCVKGFDSYVLLLERQSGVSPPAARLPVGQGRAGIQAVEPPVQASGPRGFTGRGAGATALYGGSGGETKNPGHLEIVYRHALAAVSLEEAPLAVSWPTRAPRQKPVLRPAQSGAEGTEDRPERTPDSLERHEGDRVNKRKPREAAFRERPAPRPRNRQPSSTRPASQPPRQPVRHSASPGEKQEERMNLSMEEQIRKWIRNQGLPEPKPQ